MATNNKANSNILINLFHKGMNTDTAVNMLDNEHYIYGKNVRITQQTPIGVAIDVNRTKGCITPVPKGESEKSTLQYYDTKEEDPDKQWKLLAASSVLAADSVDNYGAVIIKDTVGLWYVYRVEVNADGGLLYTFIFTAQDATTDKNRFSVVMSQELQNVIKLYVATEKGISQFDICDENYNNALTSVDQTMSNKLWPYKKPIIDKKTEGALPVGQVQWVYRLYKNHGLFSKLSAVTNKIQVFSADRRVALGNELASVDDEGKLSSSSSGIGFRLKIDLNYSDRVADAFDHVQLFRIQYYTLDVIKVFLISQVSYRKGQNSIAILDDGIEPLLEYTLEEFSALEGLDIVADSIETASQHMFAANIEDKSSIKLTLSDDVLSSHTISSDNDQNKNCRLLNDEGVGNNTTYSDAELAFVGGYFYNDGHKVEDSFEQSNYVYCPGENVFGGKTPASNDIQITWKFVEANIELHNDATHENPIPTVSANSDTKIYYIGTDGNTTWTGNLVLDYLKNLGINVIPQVYNYGDNITSSMFRSLRRGETYRYGIIYYNKYGQHTDVQWIDDIKVPSNFTSESTKAIQDGDKVTIQACPIGIEFEVKLKDGISEDSPAKDITHYQIVRCAHTKEFSKQLYLVVQNAPIRCAYKSDLSGTSPWSPVATILDFGFHTMIGYLKNYDPQAYPPKESKDRQWISTSTFYGTDETEYNSVNRYIKLLYGPDINYSRNTVLSKLQQSLIEFRPIRRLYSQYGVGAAPSEVQETPVDGNLVDGIIAHPWLDLYYNQNRVSQMEHDYGDKPAEDEYFLGRKVLKVDGKTINCLPMLGGAASMTENDSEKNVHYVALNYYMSDPLQYSNYGEHTYKIENVSSVKLPNWEDNFTDVTTGWYGHSGTYGTNGVGDASEVYKNFTTTLVDALYNNWICYDMYNLRPGFDGDTSGYNDTHEEVDADEECSMFLPPDKGGWEPMHVRGHAWSGPGPVALLAIFAQKDGKAFWGPWGTTNPNYSENGSESNERSIYETPFITTLISLEHAGSTYQGTTKSELQYDTYYGFGNYGTIGEKLIVFDGDTYITPAEILSAYKTWNKNAPYTKGIRSMTVVNYIPIESEINSTLDYGLNFKNTFNPNVQVEPCDIEGVGVQERPLFLYNMVMSYNNYSAMSFTAQSEDKIDENYPQRIFYSEQKENGEAVDNWGLFKSLNYVDANTKYGPITNLLTSKETLYFWLPSAFGKLSVNERSLVTDENSNKIQLGTGGVLLRTDYIDTNTGMSKDQYAAIGVGDTVYWIDTLRKSVMKFLGGRVASVGIESATQNLLNWKFEDNDIPHISYDIQNDEVLCRCLKNGAQYVCVNNLGIASSEYTRVYDDTITLHGVLYGLTADMATIENVRYNYLKGNIEDMLSPMELKFAIAQDPNVTKVYDNLKIVVVKDDIELNGRFDEQFENMARKYFTDIHGEQEFTGSNDVMSNREGEFEYALPRWNGDYGERIRGKWLVQDMISNNPKSDIAISLILTKVRTSFS